MYAGLEEIMSDAAEKVIETAVEKNLDMRTAAFVNAINKLHEYFSLTGVNNWFWDFIIYHEFKFYKTWIKQYIYIFLIWAELSDFIWYLYRKWWMIFY